MEKSKAFQTKVERVQHRQTSFTTNFKGTSLGRRHKRWEKPTQNKPKTIKKIVIRSCVLTQLCPTLCDPVDCSLPGSSVLGIFQAGILEWVAISFSKITQSCPTLCNPMDYTVHGILQARILEWVVFLFSRGSSQPRDRTQAPPIVGRLFSS